VNKQYTGSSKKARTFYNKLDRRDDAGDNICGDALVAPVVGPGDVADRHVTLREGGSRPRRQFAIHLHTKYHLKKCTSRALMR